MTWSFSKAHHVDHVELAGVGVDPAGVGDLAAALGVERRLFELERHAAVGEHAGGAHHGVDLEALVADERGLERRSVALEGLELAGAGLAAACCAARARSRCSAMRRSKPAFVDAHAPVLHDLAGEVERKAVGVVQLEGDLGRQLGARVARPAQGLVEDAHALGQRAREARLLFADDARRSPRGAPSSARVGLAHELDDAARTGAPGTARRGRSRRPAARRAG